MAIKIALDNIKLEMERIDIKKIMLFSDSKSAVGILTLGWENKSHTWAIFEIKQAMEILKSQNVTVKINWTPGHAEIAGNEIADKLAKEAAEEAENMPEVDTPLPPLISNGQLGTLARLSGRIDGKLHREGDTCLRSILQW